MFNVGKRGPKPNPEKRMSRVDFEASKACRELLESFAPSRGSGRPKAGEVTKSKVVFAALKLAQLHPDEFAALLDQSEPT
ncbi:hypothetical protein IAD21_00935 [Abditibacteriota bacterium]|nr:hypothetical protein IAD21_00935 [Abditibacteriota bacterium]